MAGPRVAVEDLLDASGLLADWGVLARLPGILLVNLILSGDNAVVIALAARTLKDRQRRRAIVYGSAGAVGLRILFAGFISLLLELPFLQAAGALLLLWIAWNLSGDDPGVSEVRAGSSVLGAVKIIILADAVMSLDNVLALIGVSGGNLWLLGVGVAMTVPLVVWGSSFLTSLLERWTWLIYAGTGLLVWVAAGMFLDDSAIRALVDVPARLEDAIGLAAAAFFVASSWLVRRGRGSA
ncbi:YjbE family putative metal transport protein [Rubrobacter calidifluminis]|uniref:YjbE family putative metal transport protein n=1 Tax=Rubrobacter calidifluminis TaxID=1392640 RepID=UPI0023613C05|nr:YjbE family putative metal transport protein [Rubrobacter calidifluminis]